jgi:nitrogen-specific signal transduction histidine kinase
MVLAPESRLVNIPLERLPIATAGVDGDGTILHANRRFLRLFGLDRPNPSARRLADLLAPIHRPAVQQALEELRAFDRQAPEGCASHACCSVKATRSKVPCLWLAIDISPLGPESVFPYLVCAQPIPRRRRLDVVAESWPPLLTMLSHELRGSLNAIRGWVAIAESGPLPSDSIPRAFSIIKRNAESLSRLVENLFDLSRHAAGSLALKREILDFNQLVALVVESTYPAARLHDVTVTVDCSRSALFVNGDRVRLEQVVRNLIENAIKFTPGGGKVNLRTVCHRLFGELVVDDTGAGISPDLLPAIFDPFRRGVLDVPPSDVGVGLGLALVRQLVHLHHGEIQALSRGKGRGSTFIVKLPLARASRSLHRKSSLDGRRHAVQAA